MNSAPKYQEIHVNKRVNVSSSYDYHFTVFWRGGYRQYSLGVGFLTNHKYNAYTWEGAPKYLETEVERQIAAMFADGSAVFYEYDRDGNKRYDNLRYYDAELVAWWAEHLTTNDYASPRADVSAADAGGREGER